MRPASNVPLAFSLSNLMKGGLLLLFPLVEFAVARLGCRGLGLHIGWPGFTDFDLLLPLPLAFLTFVSQIESTETQSSSLRLQARACVFHLVFVSAFILTTFVLLGEKARYFVLPLWVGIAMGMLISAFFIWVPVGYYFNRQGRLNIIPCVLLGLAVYFNTHLFQNVWPRLAESTAHSTYALFKVFIPQITSHVTPSGIFAINSPWFNLRINRGCGGGDGLFLSTFAFLLFFIRYRTTYRLYYWPVIYLGGIAVVYATNILRISLLFVLGIAVQRYSWGTPTIVHLFHLQAGWILYFIALSSYFRVVLSLNPQNMREIGNRLSLRFRDGLPLKIED